jgi:hypothetical protein
MRPILLASALLFFTFTYAQDTLTVLQYNLLWYGEETDWCDNINNNINEKDGYLRTIINYTKPDIFSVNEMSNSPAIHQHMLDMVLNTDGVDYYQKAGFLSVANTDIVNMLYFNTKKLGLHSHYIAQSYIRDIDVYKLFLLSDGILAGDTTFIICVVAHLKSSSGEENEEKRRVMASNTMNWLDNFDDSNNYMMMGDFNVYSPTEPSYQEFLNYENPLLRFLDPIDQTGEWHNNSNFSDVHTQSTHSSGNGCPSTGGMDDRFDFILISNSIKDGTKDIHYIEDSYWAVGQDGQHFNKALNALPTNTSVPEDVLNALYNNSDHLPVILKLYTDKTLGIDEIKTKLLNQVSLINPANDYLDLNMQVKKQGAARLEIFNMYGHLLMERNLHLHMGANHISESIVILQPGMFIVRITDQQSNAVSLKLIKN